MNHIILHDDAIRAIRSLSFYCEPIASVKGYYDMKSDLDTLLKYVYQQIDIGRVSDDNSLTTFNQAVQRLGGEKYEHHYDHTDCIWYSPKEKYGGPATCSQYRDGWNDAMDYVFRDGKGYRPYRRGENYE